jgi:hypothetical protein
VLGGRVVVVNSLTNFDEFDEHAARLKDTFRGNEKCMYHMQCLLGYVTSGCLYTALEQCLDELQCDINVVGLIVLHRERIKIECVLNVTVSGRQKLIASNEKKKKKRE